MGSFGFSPTDFSRSAGLLGACALQLPCGHAERRASHTCELRGDPPHPQDEQASVRLAGPAQHWASTRPLGPAFRDSASLGLFSLRHNQTSGHIPEATARASRSHAVTLSRAGDSRAAASGGQCDAHSALLVPSCVQTPAPPWVFHAHLPKRSLLHVLRCAFSPRERMSLFRPYRCHHPPGPSLTRLSPESLNVRPSAARPQVTSGDSFGGSSSASLEFPREPPQITTDSVAQIHSFRHSGGQKPTAGGLGEKPCVSPRHCGASPALALITPAQARLPTRPRPGAPRGLAAGGGATEPPTPS